MPSGADDRFADLCYGNGLACLPAPFPGQPLPPIKVGRSRFQLPPNLIQEIAADDRASPPFISGFQILTLGSCSFLAIKSLLAVD
jgi:hypothetical protein